MIDLLIKAIFYVLNFLASIILKPILILVVSIIPDITNLLTGISSFISFGFTYLSWFIKLLMIPKSLMVILITLTLGIFGIDLAFRAISLIGAIYQYFKP